MREQEIRIAFSHCITSVQERELTDSMFGDFYFGSPLSYHLQAVDFSIKVLSNIKNERAVSFGCKSEISFNLLMHFLTTQAHLMPNWEPYTEEENKFFENLFVTKDEVVSIEKETTKQATCSNWKSLRENRIISSKAHKLFMRNFFLNHCLITNSAKKKKNQKFVQDALKHGRRTNQLPGINMKLCNTK